MSKTARKKKLEQKISKKSESLAKAKVEEVKTEYCKDCKYYGVIVDNYQQPKCMYHNIFVARKNCCGNFERS